MFNFGGIEIIIIAILIIIFFGGRKIPELIKGLGESVKEFRRASRDEKK